MKRNTIPNTDLQVSPICLGTMTFGTPVSESDAIKLTHKAIESGINFFDTANMYEGYARCSGSAGGVSEKILGKALKGRRQNMVIATKLGMKVGNEPEDEGTSPAAIRKQLERSLKFLETDCIDIYYLHKFDANVAPVEIVIALDNAVKQGKIRFYGISNYTAEQTAALIRVADENKLPRPVIHQPAYSLLKREIEADLIPLCQKEKISVAPYQVLQGGLLTGKYHKNSDIPVGSRKAEKKEWLWEFNDDLFEKIQKIENEAKTKGRTLMQHALREILAQPAVVSLVLGIKNIDQLDSLVAAVG